MLRLDVADELYLVAFEQWIYTIRETKLMSLEMTKLACIGARRVYYQKEQAEFSSQCWVGLIKSWSRWQALEDAVFQKDPTCVDCSLTDTAHSFVENLAKHITQLRRRQQKITHQLL
ncbi:MAG TPA: hypothetical protein VFV38_10660 [Ktedonobacteraceae bacterium]|nr:hypothetical protein [Ktedonobacteraceae bacterium]